MNATVSVPEDAPLPQAQFKRFLAVFHFLFMAGLVSMLVLRWSRPEFEWSAKEGFLLLLVGAQAGLYTRFFVFLWKPPSALGWWLAYFGMSLGIWVVEWHLEPALRWTAWAYVGQMFGVLRPRYSVPLALGVFAAHYYLIAGWHAVSMWQAIGGGSLVVSVLALGLFLHRLTVTSSERAELIRELEAAKKELELARQKDVELAALRERERLARDLHDSLGHGLVTVTVQLEAAGRLVSTDPAKACAMLKQMQELTRTSMEELRRALAGLRMEGLGEQSLERALRDLCRKEGETGLRVECELAEGIEKLNPSVGEALWRVAQEGLRNVVKHARADSARLRLELVGGQAILTVADDGAGLAPESLRKAGHYGLRGLRERVEGLGGSFRMESNGKGTRLEVRVPVVS